MRFTGLAMGASLGLGILILMAGSFELRQPAHALAAVNKLAIDVNISGNTATSLGQLNSCAIIPSVDGTLQVDVVVDSIPAPAGSAGGLSAFSFDFTYDETIINVVSSQANLLLTSAGGSAVNVGNAPPDSDGDYAPGWADFSTNFDSGKGVLERITLKAVGIGTTTISVANDPQSLGNPALVDGSMESNVYVINNKIDATVIVGSGSCTGTPSPTPSATPSPTPLATGPTATPSPTPSPPACQACTPSPTPTASPAPLPSPTTCPDCTPTATATPTPTPTAPAGDQLWGDGDCGGSVSLGDAIGIARHLVSLPVDQGEECHGLGSSVVVNGHSRLWQDIDCSGGLSLGDAIGISRFLVSLPVDKPADCPLLGGPVQTS